LLQYVLRRLLLMFPTLLAVAFLTFSMVRCAPGDPVSQKFAGGGDGAMQGGVDMEALRQQFMKRHLLDANLFHAFLHYLGPFDLSEDGHRWFGGNGSKPWNGLLSGDLGVVYLRPQEKIAPEIARRLKVTVPFAAGSVLLAYLIAPAIGVLSAVRRGSKFDTVSSVALFVLYSIPAFWAALLLQILFGTAMLDWLPVVGLYDPDHDSMTPAGKVADVARHAILPLVCFAYGSLAYLSRQMRGGVIDTMRQDYVRTARAKGLTERSVVLKHILRNSLIPIITLFAAVLPALIGGSVIIERVFDLPGMGKYAFEALINREYNIIMAVTLFVAILNMTGILVSDILYAVADPRIRYS
jgi:peptide/nickel transport system permease protein